jgi:hypothetical protein
MGTVLVILRQCHPPSIHQAHKQRTTGRITVEDLAAIARAAKSKLKAQLHPPPVRPSRHPLRDIVLVLLVVLVLEAGGMEYRPLGSAHAEALRAGSVGVLELPACSRSESYPVTAGLIHLTKKRIDSKKNKPDSVFFISVIHATDSTITGWSAQSTAPSHAPCTRRLRKRRQSNIAQAPCNKTFTKWYGSGFNPHNACSAQKVVSVKGQISAALVVQISLNPSGPTMQGLAVKIVSSSHIKPAFRTGV